MPASTRLEPAEVVEAAVGTGQHTGWVSTGSGHGLMQAVGHQPGMLYVVGLGIDDAGNEQHPVWQWAVTVHSVFVAVTRVCHFHNQRADVGFVEKVEDVLQRNIVMVGTFAIAPADVQPNPVAGDIGQGVIDGSEDPLRSQ